MTNLKKITEKMTKKIVALAFFTFFSLTAIIAQEDAASDDPALNDLTDAVCTCLTAKKESLKTKEDFTQETQNCLMQGDNLTKMVALLGKDGNNDITNAANDIGEKMGMKLVTRCPAMLGFMMTLAAEDMKNEEALAAEPDEDTVVPNYNDDDYEMPSVTGKLVELKGKEMLTLVVETEKGKKIECVLVHSFEGSDKLMGENLYRLKGKKVKVSYTEYPVYSPKLKNFDDQTKEVQGVEVVKD